jgi:hypothetical protein
MGTGVDEVDVVSSCCDCGSRRTLAACSDESFRCRLCREQGARDANDAARDGAERSE